MPTWTALTFDRGPMPYESASDLPSFVELKRQLAALKALRPLIPRRDRPDVKDLERQLTHLSGTVDRFYEVLGERNWVFHEHLSVDRIAEILDSSSTPDEAERKLIDYYLDREDDPQFLLRPTRGFAALRRRMPLIEHAYEDYFAGRYYSTVLVLLAVMDGFVNEFESVRRGLHARRAEEMDAFDSVVAHHLGLSRAHQTFRRMKGATSDEPVHDLYRNGIVHGTLTNFGNVIVATKAWNRLFAVIDWAKAREEESRPPTPEPGLREVLGMLAASGRRKRSLDAWRPVVLTPEDAAFAGHAVTVATTDFLKLWSRRNYGGVADLVMAQTAKSYGSRMYRVIREEYSRLSLVSFSVERLDHCAAAICMVDARLEFVDGRTVTARIRWIFENEAGESAIPPDEVGSWRLVWWGPAALSRELA